jgi:hypothetical protein
MTAGVEAPVQGSVLGFVGGQAAMLEGQASATDQWSALDADVWPFDRDHGPRPLSDEADPAPPAMGRPRNRSAALDRALPAICDVVAAWRAAERDLAGLVENEPDWNRVRAEIIGMRALHQRLYEARLGSRPGKIG